MDYRLYTVDSSFLIRHCSMTGCHGYYRHSQSANPVVFFLLTVQRLPKKATFSLFGRHHGLAPVIAMISSFLPLFDWLLMRCTNSCVQHL
jgi:hypothetical protein